MERVAAVRRLLDSSQAAAILISSIPHIRWISGFAGSAGLVLIDRTRARLVTDGRYRSQAEVEAPGFEVDIADGSLLDHVGASVSLGPDQSILVQGDHLTASEFGRLQVSLGAKNTVLTDGLLDRVVALKSEDEIENIRRAQMITESVFDHLLEWLRAGLSEKEVAAEIVHQHLLRGAERMSFDPIVASGPNSALPHARPTDRRLSIGDVLLLDFGCIWNGYASDMTRTLRIGTRDDDVADVYQVVLGAQAKAILAARPGIESRDLDGVARSHITDAGYGDFFSHSLGHGVGMQVHEWPRVAQRSDDILHDSVVISIEPGIYLPGRFGVRIEDLVLLQPGGCVNLTRATKELIQIGV